MLPFDSYRDVLSEHTRGHHVASAWFVVVAIGVLIIILAI